MSESVRCETVSAEGVQMDYVRFGQGDRTFVILPGLSVGSIMMYADTVAEAYNPLTDEFTVYLFDRRKELPETYSVYDMACDTAAALRALGLEQVSLFGASQGGMIAMTIAIEHPELVGRLILGSTSACMDQEHFRRIERWIRLAKSGDAEALYLAFGEALYPREFYEQSRIMLTAAAKTVTDEDLKRFTILAEGLNGFDVTQRLSQIQCPVLVIGSRDDAVLGGEASEKIASAFEGRPDCDLFMYDGYGHAAYDLAPDFKARILRFCLRE